MNAIKIVSAKNLNYKLPVESSHKNTRESFPLDTIYCKKTTGKRRAGFILECGIADSHNENSNHYGA